MKNRYLIGIDLGSTFAKATLFAATTAASSRHRRTPGRPPVARQIEELVIRFAKENRTWDYDRVVGALANLGHSVSDQTVGSILARHGLAPAPERKKKTTWREFVRTHLHLLAATDFFTAEVWTHAGLITYHVLFFVHLATRKVHVAGITPNHAAAPPVTGARSASTLFREPLRRVEAPTKMSGEPQIVAEGSQERENDSGSGNDKGT